MKAGGFFSRHPTPFAIIRGCPLLFLGEDSGIRKPVGFNRQAGRPGGAGGLEMLKVSVLVTTYNYADYVVLALQSVFDQDYRGPVEIIVVDDGSTDATRERLAPYLDRIVYVHKENAGQGAAMNTAFNLATGDVLMILDADDLFHPAKVSAVADRFASEPHLSVVHHRLRLIGPKGELVNRAGELQTEPVLTIQTSEGEIGDRSIEKGFRWYFNPASGLSISRRSAEIVFPLNASLRGSADAQIAFLASLTGPVGFLAETLADYRIHSLSIEQTAYAGASERERKLKIAGVYSALREVQAVEGNRVLAALGKRGGLSPWLDINYIGYRSLLDGKPPKAYFREAMKGIWGIAYLPWYTRLRKMTRLIRKKIVRG